MLQNDVLYENINDNLYVPLNLALFAKEHNIHMTYIGTGCIYNYTDKKNTFSESDEPNFFGSNYSIVKGFTNLLMNHTNALHLRIRMPIVSYNHPRNFITKILDYKKIHSMENSMTVLDSMIPLSIEMMINGETGSYNFTNPGTISHNTILTMYRDIIDPNKTWENHTIEEQNQILLSKRSNNMLDTITDAMKTVFQNWEK